MTEGVINENIDPHVDRVPRRIVSDESRKNYFNVQGLLAQTGPKARGLFKKLGSNFDPSAYNAELEKIPDFKTFQDEATKILEDAGAVEWKEGCMIVDIFKLASSAEKIIADEKSEFNKKYNCYHTGNGTSFLFNAFFEKPVVMKGDWKEWEKNPDTPKPEPKPLFYNPASDAAAFDVEKIKQANFQMGAWEIAHILKETPEQYSDFHPDLAMDEVAAACLLYHPKYGNAGRDAQGKLVVNYYKDPEPKVKRINAGWVERSFFMLPIVRGDSEIIHSPTRALVEGKFPTLVRKNLLKPEDFNFMANTEFAGRYRMEKVVSQRNGMVMLDDKMRYTLGRGFTSHEGRVASVCQLSDNLYGILEKNSITGTRRLVKVFDRLKPESPNVKIQKQKASADYYVVNREFITFRNPTEEELEIFSEPSRENADTKEERGAELDEIILKETGLALKKFSWRNQLRLKSYYNKAGDQEKQKIVAFIRTYEELGVKMFLSLDSGPDSLRAVFALAEKFGPVRAGLIFAQFEELMDGIEKIDQTVDDFFKNNNGNGANKQSVASAIVKRATGRMSAYLGDDRTRDSISIRRLAEDFQHVIQDAGLFGAIFKSAIASNPELKFEDVKGVGFETKSVADISDDEKHEMIKVLEETWGDNPLGAGARRGLIAALNNKDNTFYILRRNNKIVSFDRFQKIRDNQGAETDEVEFASFNTRQEFQKFGIGTAMMKQSVDREAVDNIVVAEADPLSDITQHYIEKTGFVITGAHENYKGTGMTVLSIRRNDRVKISRSGPLIELGDKRTVVANVARITESGKIVVKYVFDREKQKFFGITKHRPEGF